MKKIIIKLVAVLCFFAGPFLMLYGVEMKSFWAVILGFGVFSLLVPISRSKVF